MSLKLEGEAVIKHISVIHRNEGVSREEFRRYWTEVHVPLVKKGLPGLRKYVGNFPVRNEGERHWGIEMRGSVLDCDLIVELHFDDMNALLEAMRSPGWLNDERRASSSRVIDYSMSKMTVTEVYAALP
jgi:uncharacterized protein (TIGR02118 family)